MRLIKLRFKNLNSLYGEWEIDFTNPSFTTDKLFVITGPTGAGKTTILDAICLGLYGETPRLGEINASTSDIMSRHEKECFAEVIFEVESGIFLSSFSLLKTGKKGTIKKKEEISNFSSGAILETSYHGKKSKIKELTGMDFSHFTRSILLAQGSFSAFLTARHKERSPILERITGTDIYSQISRFVFELTKENKEKLSQIRKDLDGIALLTVEEEKEIRKSLEDSQLINTQLSEKLKDKNIQIVTLERIEQLNKDLVNLFQERDILNKDISDFSPLEIVLKKAQMAFELEGDFSILQNVRKIKLKNDTDLEKVNDILPSLQVENDKHHQALLKATEDLDNILNEQKSLVPVLIEVRALDKNISEIVAIFNNTEAEKNKVTALIKQLQNEQSNYKSQESKKSQRLNIVSAELVEKNQDEILIEKLSGIRQASDQYRDLLHKNETLTKEIFDVKKMLEEQQVNIQKTEEPIKKLQDNQQKDQEQLLDIEQSLNSILNGRELKSYHEEKANYKTLEDSFKWMSDLWQIINTRIISRDKQLNDKNDLLNKLESIKNDISQNQNSIDAKEKEIELIEQNLLLSKAVASLTAHRESLLDGSPCPLCGSLEHPYAKGNIPVPGDTESRLLSAKKERKTLEKVKIELQKNDATWQKQITIIDSSVKEIDLINLKDKASLDNALKAANLTTDYDPETFLPFIDKAQAKNNKDLLHVSQIINDAEALEKRYNSKNEDIKKNYRDLEVATKTLTELKDKVKQLEGYLERSSTVQNETNKSIISLVKHLNLELQPFDRQFSNIESLTNILDDLLLRQKAFVKLKDEKLALEKEISELIARIEGTQKSITENLNTVEDFAQTQAELLRKKDTISQTRFALFGERLPDEEEKRIRSRFDNASKAKNSFQDNFNQSTNTLKELQSKRAELVRIKEETEHDLNKRETFFLSALSGKGFQSEALFLEARLSEEERERLLGRQKDLADAKTRLSSLISEKSKSLEEEKAKNLSEVPLHDLKQELILLQEEQKTLQENTGALRQRLLHNDELKVTQEGKLAEQKAQEDISHRYEVLNKYIGSADGDKFRTLAQGLAFKLLVQQANIHLQKMSGRYLLRQDKEDLLEFNIQDDYQGGVLRSTKTLSGGESFIVSLSLALGLSFLSRENVQLDSFFLDEGFGTLDEEALDTAISTLSELPTVEGKTIGLISHVGGLTDRISTQIKVIPQNGGRSILSGPGCRRLS
ncbi:MAG: AAA family ATPase [Deltaproteobacteria bacterium]|jgi:exonuclease SbcC|nr:AAA family ATPase [Deltaproteobacteria bacterium]